MSTLEDLHEEVKNLAQDSATAVTIAQKAAERKEETRNHYRIIIDSLLKDEDNFQLLCCNCNWIKRSENNELKRKYE